MYWDLFYGPNMTHFSDYSLYIWKDCAEFDCSINVNSINVVDSIAQELCIFMDILFSFCQNYSEQGENLQLWLFIYPFLPSVLLNFFFVYFEALLLGIYTSLMVMSSWWTGHFVLMKRPSSLRPRALSWSLLCLTARATPAFSGLESAWYILSSKRPLHSDSIYLPSFALLLYRHLHLLWTPQ